MAGVSRSATLVIAFLMRSRLLSFEEAYNLVKQKRKIVFLLAFRYIPIHHLFNNYDSSNPNFSNQIKNSLTSQQAVAGTLPNQ
jgi:protein-tyrosine phosphatase